MAEKDKNNETLNNRKDLDNLITKLVDDKDKLFTNKDKLSENVSSHKTSRKLTPSDIGKLFESIRGATAVPIDDVWKKITDLRDHGYITGAALGVMVHDVDQQTAIYYGLPMGAYVTEVNAGSAAERAGVQARDIIVSIGEDPITSLNELDRVLEKYSGGENTTISVWRGGKEITLDITLDARTPDF
jgi:S1-C subfamily serine protease